jgi:hypothetical protein
MYRPGVLSHVRLAAQTTQQWAVTNECICRLIVSVRLRVDYFLASEIPAAELLYSTAAEAYDARAGAPIRNFQRNLSPSSSTGAICKKNREVDSQRPLIQCF